MEGNRYIKWGTLLFAYSILYNSPLVDSIASEILPNLGILISSTRPLVYYAQNSPQFIVVSFIPNLPASSNGCNLTSLLRYKTTVKQLLTPLYLNIQRIIPQNQTSRRRKRFAGVAIGLAALGVATAAQVTAAIALNKANANAAAIQQLASSLDYTNNAIQSLISGSKVVGTAIQAIQSQINNVIIPAMDQMQCQIYDNKIAGILNLYLIELITIFGSSVTNPALQPLSIQAIYTLLQGTAMAVLNNTDMVTNNGITVPVQQLYQAQVMAVDLNKLTITLSISNPSLAPESSAWIYDILTITVNTNNTEYLAQIPNRVLEQGGLYYAFGGDHCVSTESSFLCEYSDASLLPKSTQQCLTGNLNQCPLSPIVASLPTRFASMGGNIIANCKNMKCQCSDPIYPISQSSAQPITVITAQACKSIWLDNLNFVITPSENITYQMNVSINQNQILHTAPLDISLQLKQLNSSLTDAEYWLDASRNALEHVDTNSWSFIWLVVLSVLIAILCLLILLQCLMMRFLYRQLYYRHDEISLPPPYTKEGSNTFSL
uniref:Fusion glycoprotein F0 n=1 Tax=Bat paramyxovirus TaxID=1300978 RepID=A0A0D3MD37_9MONO|nr:fusion protein [Bat paramyxovirus]